MGQSLSNHSLPVKARSPQVAHVCARVVDMSTTPMPCETVPSANTCWHLCLMCEEILLRQRHPAVEILYCALQLSAAGVTAATMSEPRVHPVIMTEGGVGGPVPPDKTGLARTGPRAVAKVPSPHVLLVEPVRLVLTAHAVRAHVE